MIGGINEWIAEGSPGRHRPLTAAAAGNAATVIETTGLVR
jgi:hypothetical protein